jgi:hypothetical protein
LKDVVDLLFIVGRQLQLLHTLMDVSLTLVSFSVFPLILLRDL